MPGRIYLAIDLKSFYASVECVERGLDPLTCNLVVADTALAAIPPLETTWAYPAGPGCFRWRSR